MCIHIYIYIYICIYATLAQEPPCLIAVGTACRAQEVKAQAPGFQQTECRPRGRAVAMGAARGVATQTEDPRRSIYIYIYMYMCIYIYIYIYMYIYI